MVMMMIIDFTNKKKQKNKLIKFLIGMGLFWKKLVCEHDGSISAEICRTIERDYELIVLFIVFRVREEDQWELQVIEFF